MLINLRNALMAGKRLPYDAEVEYLAATGRQWINTGVDAWGNIEFEVLVDFSEYYPTSSGGYEICGAYVETGGKQVYAIANNRSIKRYNGGRDGSTFHSFSVNTFQGRVDLIKVLKTGAYINDSVWRAGETQSVNENGYTFLIFRAAGYGDRGLVGAIRSCKIWKDNTLVRDYIPVRKGTVGYLYDRVSGKLFGNAGTGDFVLGPDVVPVEYIESHGMEWIDTGFKASNSTRVAVYFELTSSTLDRWILGARNGTASATDKFALFCGNSSYAMIGSAMGEFSVATIKTGRHLLDMSLAGGVVVDSQIVATYSASEQAEVFSATYAMALFNLWNGSLNSPFIGKYYACDFWDNGDPVRKFRPVRVGTEGAMMDVLTRRIYRNAGTGAFSYGNDLPYPIPA